MATPTVTLTLEERVTKLEAQMEALAEKPATWKAIVGTFKDDPLHEEAVRLGRAYRESLRPKEG